MQKVNRFRKTVALQVIEEKRRINKIMLEIIGAIKTVKYKNFTPPVGEQIEAKNSIFVYLADSYKYNSSYGITHNVTPIDGNERPIKKCIELDYYNYSIVLNNFKINLGAIEQYHKKNLHDIFIPKFNAGANKELYTKLCIDIFNDAAKELQTYRVEKQKLVDDAFMIHFGFYVNRAFY